jgi:hypothetical protein
MVRGLKQELQLNSNTDFLSDALALFHWAVAERRRGHRIFSETQTGERKELVLPRLERVAPELSLPRVEISWTARELESLATLVTREPAHPTETLLRAMRGRMSFLISEAFKVALRVADEVGCRGIIADVYRARVDWYARYGFVALEGSAPSGPQRMFLDIRTVRMALR